MHLLAAQAGAIQQDGEAIDLGQTRGEVVFASAADSELALLAGAADRAGFGGLRLANLMRLSHHLSVDMWIDRTVRHARLVVVRLLGGPSYWQYGVDELTALRGVTVAFLPGDANPDPILRERSTIAGEDWNRLHALFVAGGPENADAILDGLVTLSAPLPASPTRGEVPAGAGGNIEPHAQDHTLPLVGRAGGGGLAKPFPRFGLWYPGRGMVEDVAGAVPILFYRAALEGGGTVTLEALVAEVERQGMAPVPILVSSLREQPCVRFVRRVFEQHPPSVILNLTGFALGLDGIDETLNPFAGTDAPVIQLVQGGRPASAWRADIQGLTSKDLAMQIVLPELDGRIGGLIVGHKDDAVWHARTQCPLSAYAPDHDGIRRAVTLASNWTRLRETPVGERRVAIVLANYPIRDGRLANGVGYDAPESTVRILKALESAGIKTTPHPIPPPQGGRRPLHDLQRQRRSSPSPLRGGDRGGGSSEAQSLPVTGNDLIELLLSGPTNANPQRGRGILFPLADYIPDPRTTVRWGSPAADPFVRGDTFHLPGIVLGNVAVLLQPSRGYHLDETASYHDPDLVPPHGYAALYQWVRRGFDAHAIIHNGKHGNLEWLPGKATALSGADWPAALWSELPHLYPFIVNDPGEGTQAKRRTGAVIVDHLVPPLTRAETYGPLKDLEALLDEYYAASGMDRRRLKELRRRILAFARDASLDRDVALTGDETEDLRRVDTFLCELKEAQIRDGLHIFGASPEGRQERDTIVALARVPRGEGPGEASLIRALADDLKLGFDPLTADLGKVGREVDKLEALAARLKPQGPASAAVLETVEAIIRPRLRASGPNEMAALLWGLDGKFIAPGPSGAPSRGRLDVLPTGRNFYSVDIRAVPTPTAWELGKKSAEALIERHFQDHGTWLRSLALSVWGTANMRTGGDDIAQALALIGSKPVWDPGSLRVSGYEIVPLAKLGRPRVDVTLRISGFFRDAFPAQIALFDRAIRAIGALDEPESENPIAARMRTDALALMKDGQSEVDAAMGAGHRIFGSKPGAYGAGLQGLIDSGTWQTKADLAKAVLNWGQYAYGATAAGLPERDRFAARLGDIEAVVQNQDNREHDLLDSDDYYQFEGGLVAAAESLTGNRPIAYHNDHSRPETPRPRTLEEEISRVMRSRVVNPKWIDGVKRHGYKGAFEIIATVDYMFAFAATTGAVKTHHFDLAFAAYVEDDATRRFIQDNNRYGWDELLAKFNEARERGYWTPRSNQALDLLDAGSRSPSPIAGRVAQLGPAKPVLAELGWGGVAGADAHQEPPPLSPPRRGEGDPTAPTRQDRP